MGLTRKRMLDCDALFFYQLLLPIVHPSMSGIEEDSHMGFYEEVARNSNLYAIRVKNRGGTRGHMFSPTNAEELLTYLIQSITHHYPPAPIVK